MSSLLEWFFDRRSRPIRREIEVRRTVHRDGSETIDVERVHAAFLSPDGVVDRATVESDAFFHCGCRRGETGGVCGMRGCQNVSCTKCFGRCESCALPLCLRHSQWVVGRGERHRVCLRCLRSLRARRAVLELFSPFVERLDVDGPR